MIEAAAHALSRLLEPARFGILVAGVMLGLLLGVLPGLGGVVGLAILIPFTYNLDPYAAFALLLGMAAVTTISDLIPAVLFGVPGSVGAAATVIDGHELARKGQAGRALGAGYTAALIGGIFGALLLAVGLPLIRPIVLYMGSSELLAFCIFGLSMVAVLSGSAPLKGLTGVGLGLMLAMIGSGSQSGTPPLDIRYFLSLGSSAAHSANDRALRNAGARRNGGLAHEHCAWGKSRFFAQTAMDRRSRCAAKLVACSAL